jgi:hypothetical protein
MAWSRRVADTSGSFSLARGALGIGPHMSVKLGSLWSWESVRGLVATYRIEADQCSAGGPTRQWGVVGFGGEPPDPDGNVERPNQSCAVAGILVWARLVAGFWSMVFRAAYYPLTGQCARLVPTVFRSVNLHLILGEVQQCLFDSYRHLNKQLIL